MIDSFTSIGSQYFYGTWYSNIHSTEGKSFQYELMDEPRKSYGFAINNLILTQGRKTIKTNWDFGWQPRQIVVDNYGTRWKIEEVMIMPQEVNPQVAHFALNPDIDYVLSLVMITNPLEKK